MLQSWTKNVRNFTLSYLQDFRPADWYLNDSFPYPTLVIVVQSGTEMIQPDFNIVLGMNGGVFVVASAFKNFFLKLDMTTSVF